MNITKTEEKEKNRVFYFKASVQLRSFRYKTNESYKATIKPSLEVNHRETNRKF